MSEKSEKKNYQFCVARGGFSLLEVLVVLGVVMILIGLLMPTLGSARRRAAQIVCAAELRDMAMAISVYATAERGYVPFAYLQTDEPEVWLAGETRIDPASFSTAGDFWVRPMLDSYGGSWLSEALLCPEDTVSEGYGQWASDQTGIPIEELGIPLVRALSRSFYYAPVSLHDDLPTVGVQDCKVATLSDVMFPSQKALLVEGLPFHMAGFVGPEIHDQFRPCLLNVAGVDGSVVLRSQADAVPGVLVEPLPPPWWWPGTYEDWRDDQLEMAAFHFTRDGVHGRDW